METDNKSKARLLDVMGKVNPSFISRINEIKHFSPTENHNLPNGHGMQKGGFLHDCEVNSRKFKQFNEQYLITSKLNICEAIHPQQWGLSDYKGGVIIFSTDINSLDISNNLLFNWFSKTLKSFYNRLFSKKILKNVISGFNSKDEKINGGGTIDDYIGAFSIGNFFTGHFTGDNGKVFDEHSLSIEVNGISSEGLIYLGEEIATKFHQETILVKDFNSNKIYLVNGDRNGSYDTSIINTKTA